MRPLSLMTLLLLTLLLSVSVLSMRAVAATPAPAGVWLTQDHDGVVRVFPCGANLCAEIAGVILDHPNDPTPRDYRGVSQCHLPLITDAAQVGANLWKGHITDPRNGSIYGVELHLDPRNNLALRGFLGIPLLGHTQTWTRYSSPLPPDCRLHAKRPGLNG